jgi:hypothetical protein
MLLPSSVLSQKKEKKKKKKEKKEKKEKKKKEEEEEEEEAYCFRSFVTCFQDMSSQPRNTLRDELSIL